MGPCGGDRDHPSGKKGNVLTVEFKVAGVSCIGLNGGPTFKHNEAFSFQIATDDQAETDRYWNAIVGNGGQESACGWCKDKWGVSWQITPRVLTEAMAVSWVQSTAQSRAARCAGLFIELSCDWGIARARLVGTLRR